MAAFMREQGALQRWVVGFSGGLDSTVLLHVLSQLPQRPPLLALHVHHGLSARADDWVTHAEAVARACGAGWQVERVAVERRQASLEDAARRARYDVYDRILRPGDGLLLGHHRDDQAETLLLRLLRGAGPRGLGAMAAVRGQGAGLLLRPLLSLPRTLLEACARELNLSWIEDDSNGDDRLDRNYIRRHIAPLLAARWPAASESLARSARLCREQDQLLQALAAEDLARLDLQHSAAGASIDLAGLRDLSRPRRHNVLRQWSELAGVAVPPQAQLAEFERQLLPAGSAGAAVVSWSDVSWRCFRERLYLLPQLPPLPAPECADLSAAVTLAGAGILRATADAGSLDPRHTYSVQLRRGGERCQPLGRRHSQTLKKLLQEAQVAPWLRERLPLVFCGEALAAVADLWICADFAVADRPGWGLHWQTPFQLPPPR